MRIAFDVFGGDNCPEAAIDGCIEFLNRHHNEHNINIELFGDESVIRTYLNERGFTHPGLSIFNAPEVITCEDQPTTVIKTKVNSSMVHALKRVADCNAQCMVSSGSTGALLSGATLIVKRIKGIKRPALAPILPTLTGGRVLLVDAGANADCRPEYLAQFAQMGTQYMSAVFGMTNPRVALLSNGIESTKGNELVRDAHDLLKQMSGINFIGNCEASDALSGNIDIIVCDGFSGNILLKSLEGGIGALMLSIKRELSKTIRSKIGGALIRPGMRQLKSTFDARETGGAIFLGVNGGIVKAHGNSDAKAFCNALERAYSFINGSVVDRIREQVQNTQAQ